MAYELWSARTGFKATDNVIHRLIRGAIQTGAFSTICAAGNLIFFSASTVSKTSEWTPNDISFSCFTEDPIIWHVRDPFGSHLHERKDLPYSVRCQIMS